MAAPGGGSPSGSVDVRSIRAICSGVTGKVSLGRLGAEGSPPAISEQAFSAGWLEYLGSSREIKHHQQQAGTIRTNHLPSPGKRARRFLGMNKGWVDTRHASLKRHLA